MELTTDGLRRFAGIDSDVATDEEVQGWLEAAADWYRRAGVPRMDSPSYGFWVINLAAWMYDHKGSGEDIPGAFVSSVHQLRPLKG